MQSFMKAQKIQHRNLWFVKENQDESYIQIKSNVTLKWLSSLKREKKLSQITNFLRIHSIWKMGTNIEKVNEWIQKEWHLKIWTDVKFIGIDKESWNLYKFQDEQSMF